MERYVIHVTKICNMKCVYCYEKDKSSTYTWEEIKKLIDDICSYNKNFSIEFLGGEPMLAWDLIKKSIDYFNTKEDVFVDSYAITTNGTIINDEVLEYMKNERLYFAISLDGGYFANQLRIMKDNRNGFDVAMKTIEKIREHGLIDKMNIHMTTHPYNVALIAKSIDLFYHNGVRSVGVGIIESTMKFGKEYYDEWIRQLKFISDEIKVGNYPNLIIHELDALKPPTDVRHYIKDSTGKVVAESYGRVENDITGSDKYKSLGFDNKTEVAQHIDEMRRIVFEYHQDHYNK